MQASIADLWDWDLHRFYLFLVLIEKNRIEREKSYLFEHNI